MYNFSANRRRDGEPSRVNHPFKLNIPNNVARSSYSAQHQSSPASISPGQPHRSDYRQQHNNYSSRDDRDASTFDPHNPNNSLSLDAYKRVNQITNKNFVTLVNEQFAPQFLEFLEQYFDQRYDQRYMRLSNTTNARQPASPSAPDTSIVLQLADSVRRQAEMQKRLDEIEMKQLQQKEARRAKRQAYQQRKRAASSSPSPDPHPIDITTNTSSSVEVLPTPQNGTTPSRPLTKRTPARDTKPDMLPSPSPTRSPTTYREAAGRLPAAKAWQLSQLPSAMVRTIRSLKNKTAPEQLRTEIHQAVDAHYKEGKNLWKILFGDTVAYPSDRMVAMSTMSAALFDKRDQFFSA